MVKLVNEAGDIVPPSPKRKQHPNLVSGVRTTPTAGNSFGLKADSHGRSIHHAESDNEQASTGNNET